MPVTGTGDIGSVIQDREGFLFFASGVSNSQETRETEYQREKDLLLAQDRSLHIVYFGSLSVFYSDSRYAKHKKEMEGLVKQFPKYTIMRIGNISFGKNPHTLINHIRNKIKNKETIEVQAVYRFVVDLPEFLYWVSMIPEWNCEMTIIGRKMLVSEILNEVENGLI